MDEILNANVNEIAGMSFDCSCGERHSVELDTIEIGKGVINKVPEIAAGFKKGKVLLVADSNTYRVCGEKVHKQLMDNGFKLKLFIFDTPDHQLVPDEKTVGRLLIEVEADTSLIIAVGSGVINDIAKFISHKTKIPCIVVGTAPSMDGYASVVSPLIVGGEKITYKSTYPVGFIGDTDILKDAPLEMLQAGFGDIAGKLTALADWELARRAGKERYCKTCERLVKDALNKCVENINGIAARDEKAIGYLTEGLVLSGVAIGLFGDSRPASGSEHFFAHYWDVDAISRNVEHPLHGNSVGVGTVIVAYIYELMKSNIPEDLNYPKPEEVTALLGRLGCHSSPRELGISRELFERSVYNSHKSRARYTILHMAEEKSMLEHIAPRLIEIFY